MKNNPFSIFVLTSFPGHRLNFGAECAAPISVSDLDSAIASLGCRADVSLPKTVCPAEEVSVEIRRIADLSPDRLLLCSDYLSRIVDALEFVKGAPSEAEAAAVFHNRFPGLPVDVTIAASRTDTKQESGESALDSLFSKIAFDDDVASTRPVSLASQLEEILSEALFYIYNDEDFRKLESTVRGLSLLIDQGQIREGNDVALTLLPITEDNLEVSLRSIVRAQGERQPSLVLIDLPFDNSYASIDTLETLGNFAEAVNAPVAVNLLPEFFGIKEWGEISRLPYLSHLIDSQPYAKFRVQRKTAAASRLVCVLPKFIYRDRLSGVDIFGKTVRFKERSPAYASPVYALGAMAAQSQKAFGWASRLTDRRICRVAPRVTSEGQGGRAPVATVFTEDRISQLFEVGVTPLFGEASSNSLFLNRAVTLDGGTLAYQLFSNRVLCFFFHERDVIAREGGVRTPENLVAKLKQSFFQHWSETGQPNPDDLVIGIAHHERGEVVLSIRMMPPKALVPEAKLFEFDLAFEI